MTYGQHRALRTTDIVRFRACLEKKGTEFLTPIYRTRTPSGRCSNALLRNSWTTGGASSSSYSGTTTRTKSRRSRAAKARGVLHEIIDHVDPKGYPPGAWAIAKAYKQ